MKSHLLCLVVTALFACSDSDYSQQQLQCTAEVRTISDTHFAFYYASIWRTGDEVIGICSVEGSSETASGVFIGQSCVLPNYEFAGGVIKLRRGRQLDHSDADQVWVTIDDEFIVTMDCFRVEDL